MGDFIGSVGRALRHGVPAVHVCLALVAALVFPPVSHAVQTVAREEAARLLGVEAVDRRDVLTGVRMCAAGGTNALAEQLDYTFYDGAFDGSFYVPYLDAFQYTQEDCERWVRNDFTHSRQASLVHYRFIPDPDGPMGPNFQFQQLSLIHI